MEVAFRSEVELRRGSSEMGRRGGIPPMFFEVCGSV
jgi:hypothetical protein